MMKALLKIFSNQFIDDPSFNEQQQLKGNTLYLHYRLFLCDGQECKTLCGYQNKYILPGL